MLMLFSKQIAELPLSHCFPFKANELAFMPGPRKDIFFVLKDIRDPDGYMLSIKRYMEDSPVFACSDFDARMDEFAKIMDTRLERFFDTKKTNYIFFDKEEQEKLGTTLVNKKLSCVVDVYVRKGKEVRRVNLERLSERGYSLIRKPINEMGAVMCIRPDQYMRMTNQLRNKGKSRSDRFSAFSNKRKQQENNTIDEIFAKYPELKVEDTKEFAKAYRKLAIKLHPDKNQGDETAADKFADMIESVEKLKETSWFRNLKDGDTM